MSKSITRRELVVGAGAGGIAAAAGGCAGMVTGTNGISHQDPPEEARDTECVNFEKVWPEKLWEPGNNDANMPPGGYPRAARLIYGLAASWMVLHENDPDTHPDTYYDVKEWVRGQNYARYNKNSAVLPDPGSAAGRFFRDMWYKEAQSNHSTKRRSRARGLQPRAVAAAFLGGGPENTERNYGWCRKAEVQRAEDQQNGAVPRKGEEADSTDPPLQEEVAEIIDELP